MEVDAPSFSNGMANFSKMSLGHGATGLILTVGRLRPKVGVGTSIKKKLILPS